MKYMLLMEKKNVISLLLNSAQGQAINILEQLLNEHVWTSLPSLLSPPPLICILGLTKPYQSNQQFFICMKELYFVSFAFINSAIPCSLQSIVWVAT